MRTIFPKTVLGIVCVCCLFSSPAFSRGWGKIMVVTSDANVRAAPSSRAKIKARVKAGHRLKADFLKGGWYAVFRRTEKVRSKKKILGYIAAKSLKPAAYAVRSAAAPPSRTVVKKPGAHAALQAAAGPSLSKTRTGEERTSADQLPHAPAGTAGGGAAGPGPVVRSPVDGIVLRDIRFKPGPRGHEKVLIYFNQQALPDLSSIQNERPRVVADFKDVAAVRPGLKHIPAGGSFIKRIRSSYNPKTRILRIVLDLDISKNYLVNQVFFQKENIYVFDVSED